MISYYRTRLIDNLADQELLLIEEFFDIEGQPTVFLQRSVGKAEFANANQAELLPFPKNHPLIDF